MRAVADKGIIFSAPMVRALLEGRKTQTRRLLKPTRKQAATWGPDFSRCPSARADGKWISFEHPMGGPYTCIPQPYAPGDRLYVREAYSEHTAVQYHDRIKGVVYRADLPEREPPITNPVTEERLLWVSAPQPWHPSIHMPRWASRLTLTVTDVRVQRLQEISENDCYEEGLGRPTGPRLGSDVTARDNACRWYRELWNTLHTKPGETWADNPWVCCVKFSVEHRNIDR